MAEQTQQNPVQVEGAHTLGVMGVSWAPAVPRGSLTSGKAPGPPARRFATGGCDNTVKVWAHGDLPLVPLPYFSHARLQCSCLSLLLLCWIRGISRTSTGFRALM